MSADAFTRLYLSVGENETETRQGWQTEGELLIGSHPDILYRTFEGTRHMPSFPALSRPA